MHRRLSRAVVVAGIAAALSLGAVPPAQAQGKIDRLEQQIEKSKKEQQDLSKQLQNLDGKKSDLKDHEGELKASLEGLDEDIAKKITELENLQAQLPGAQQAVTDAEARVDAAAAEVESLNQRVYAAEDRRADIQAEIEAAEAELTQANEQANQIAAEAYKNGGVSSNLSFVLGVQDSSLPEAMGLAQQAVRLQDAKASDAAQQASSDRNAASRLEAVEEEIRDLKGQAEVALAAEETARDEATAAKAELDGMITSTEELTAELEAERPRIQARIDANQTAQETLNSEILAQQREINEAESVQSELETEHAEAVAEAERKRKAAQEAERKAREAERKAAAARASAEQKRQAQAARKKANSATKASRAADKKVTQTASRSSKSSGGSNVNRGSAWGLILPLNTYQTSGFGWRPTPAGTFDYGGRGGYVHTGIDYGGGCGLPIKAARSGTVLSAGWAGTAGNRVVLDHGRVNGKLLATKYHHMTRFVVRPGNKVSQGEIIGYTGTTGNSTGCHLHFETLLNGTPVNPAGLL